MEPIRKGKNVTEFFQGSRTRAAAVTLLFKRECADIIDQMLAIPQDKSAPGHFATSWNEH